jgi:hypothetical protein
MKKYNVDVVFSTTISYIIWSNSKADAMEKAENKAAEEFRDLLDNGYLGTSDFTYEAQEP